jgi:hypothetical protein
MGPGVSLIFNNKEVEAPRPKIEPQLINELIFSEHVL